jgi:hypothetical protein
MVAWRGVPRFLSVLLTNTFCSFLYLGINRDIPPLRVYLSSQDRMNDDADYIFNRIEFPIDVTANVFSAPVDSRPVESKISEIANDRHYSYFFLRGLFL